jgi:hypothetical protein
LYIVLVLTHGRGKHEVAQLVKALGYKPEGSGSIPDEAIEFLILPNPSSCTIALGSTQPLTETSIRKLPGVKRQPTRKADNFNAICEPNVQKIREPRRFRNLWASMACYKDSFTIFINLRELNKTKRILNGDVPHPD